MAAATAWSHRDLLRLSHPTTQEPARRALFDWITHGTLPPDDVEGLGVVRGFLAAQSASTVAEWVALIADHPLSWKMLPDAALPDPDVWRALIAKGLPQTALLRQLPRLTKLGVLAKGEARRTVVEQLTDVERLRRGRVHPINVLVAARTYASGQSARGDSSWDPHRAVVDALDAAFYAAFGAVNPAGKRTLVALDVSGSMTQPVSGLPITCREASAALALVTLATEPDADVVGFTSGARSQRGYGWGHDTAISGLPLSPRQRLDDAIRSVSNLPFGGTDCALPMTWATAQSREYDTFIVITDNETWAGSVHPHQALAEYRQQVVPGARLVVVGMTASEISISDPEDPGSLDIAGFDSAVPNLISDFSRGDV